MMIIEILKFPFESFSHFIGVWILLEVLYRILKKIAEILMIIIPEIAKVILTSVKGFILLIHEHWNKKK